MTTDYDIIISGGGMVGLALALAAAKFDLRAKVIEQQPLPPVTKPDGEFAPRVSAINHASERLLTQLNAWQRIPKHRRSLYQHMNVWDGLGQGTIGFSADHVQANHLGHIIENDEIVYALWQAANEHPNVDISESDRIVDWQQTDTNVSVTTERSSVFTAKVLVGCDGKRSVLRTQSSIEQWSWDYHHTAIVSTVRHENPHNQTASQVFLESGPLALLPLESPDPTEHVSSLVWSAKRTRAEALMALPDDEFLAELNHAFERRFGGCLSVDRRFAFPLTAQQAKTYRDGRLIILGDAAHSIHPLAGLGVNLGFLDAATLADVWQKAHSQDIDIGHDWVARRFQRQRQTHNLAVGALMEGLKRLFDTQAALPVIARNAGLNLFNQSSILKRPLILGALGDFGVELPPLCR